MMSFYLTVKKRKLIVKELILNMEKIVVVETEVL